MFWNVSCVSVHPQTTCRIVLQILTSYNRNPTTCLHGTYENAPLRSPCSCWEQLPDLHNFFPLGPPCPVLYFLQATPSQYWGPEGNLFSRPILAKCRTTLILVPPCQSGSSTRLRLTSRSASPSPISPPFSFIDVSTNKCLTHLILSWHLYLRGSELIWYSFKICFLQLALCFCDLFTWIHLSLVH